MQEILEKNIIDTISLVNLPKRNVIHKNQVIKNKQINI